MSISPLKNVSSPSFAYNDILHDAQRDEIDQNAAAAVADKRQRDARYWQKAQGDRDIDEHLAKDHQTHTG